MLKSIIVAKGNNNVIGKDNDLVWHMPADLKHFKNTTFGHYIIMGRKTFEALKKPLPGRTTIVITRNNNYQAEGCIVVHNIEEAFKIGKDNNQEEVFILGGAEIYRLSMDMADKIYLTEIKASFEGDAFFPEIDYSTWKETKRQEYEPDEKNPYPYAFVELKKNL